MVQVKYGNQIKEVLEMVVIDMFVLKKENITIVVLQNVYLEKYIVEHT
jgi:hypothetical protein